MQDTAARGRDRLVIDAEGAPLLVVEARRAKYAMGVTIDEAGEEDAADLLGPLCAGSLLARAHPGDSVLVDQNGGILEDFDVGHLAPPAGARRPATCHHLPRADEECLQSRSPLIGKRI